MIGRGEEAVCVLLPGTQTRFVVELAGLRGQDVNFRRDLPVSPPPRGSSSLNDELTMGGSVHSLALAAHQHGSDRMEKLRCKTCGCESLRPMEVVFEEEDEVDDLLGEEQESRFYSCQVCGDNWLSVKEKTADGECTLTFVHQMGTSPVLKRVAHMNNSVVISDDSVDEWEYFKGDEPVDESEWESVLSDRRDTLKATCMN
jgi:hypothetical protein